MNKYFEIIRTTRNNFIELVNNLTTEELNAIPKGFNNNIAWNFGHIVVTTQGLCYRLSGLPTTIDADIIDRYKKGSKPTSFINQQEIDFLKNLAITNIDALEADYNNGVFKEETFTPYPTSFNFQLNNIKDSIAMLQSHDALHYGYALAQRRFIKNI